MTTPIIVILVAITLIALAVVNAVNLRQRHLKQLARQQQQLYDQLTLAEDALQTTLRTLESFDIARQVNQHIAAIIEQLIDIERFNPEPLKARLTIARQRQQALDSGTIARELNRNCRSDAEIAMLQGSLTQASRIINERHAKGALDNEQARHARQLIDWGKLQISVLSIIAAGYAARDGHLVSSCLSYFQKAQDLLQGSQNTDPRRLEMVRQLSAVTRGEREYIDTELFPEYSLQVDSESALGEV